MDKLYKGNPFQYFKLNNASIEEFNQEREIYKLHEIFDWYNQHKDYMKLNSKARDTVEDILSKIKKKLEENENA